jgi:hypothetical protein
LRKKIFLCDIDGTLALMDGRSPYEWHRVGEDKPNFPVITVVRALSDTGYELGLISGRMEQCREATLNWLDDHLGVPVTELWMRPDGDYRPDEELKREIYARDIEPGYEVLGVFDDRGKVVRMWRELGLTCFAVAEGNF